MTLSSIPLLDSDQTPLFGHRAAFARDRLGLFTKVREVCGPVGRIALGPMEVVVVTGPEPALEVLEAHAADYQKSRGLALLAKPLLGAGLLSSHGAEHKRQRKRVAPAFYRSAIADYTSTILETTGETLAQLRPGQEVDVGQEMMALTLRIVCRTLFHSEIEGQTEAVGRAFTQASEALLAQLSSPLPLPWPWPSPANLRLVRASRTLQRIVEGLIEARRRDPRPQPKDVLQLLLGTQDEDGQVMSKTALRDEVVTLFLAGHETTANALTWAFELLDRHPKVAERLGDEARAAPSISALAEAELPYARAVLEETMRLYPPAYFVGRRATVDTNIAGHRIPAGTTVFVVIRELHRRPESWPEPDLFRPERFLGVARSSIPAGAYLPFGAGPRVCIGNHFALLEGTLILSAFARSLRLARARPAPTPTAQPLITLRPKDPIRLLAQPLAEGPQPPRLEAMRVSVSSG